MINYRDTLMDFRTEAKTVFIFLLLQDYNMISFLEKNGTNLNQNLPITINKRSE